MPKIKLSFKEIKRLSLILEKEMNIKMKNLTNMNEQNFQSEERKKALLKVQSDDLDFVNIIKEKFDSEIFGRNG